MAAVAVIDRTLAKRKLLRLIDDSKKLVLEDREKAYEAMIGSGAVRFAVGEASVAEIDRSTSCRPRSWPCAARCRRWPSSPTSC